MVAYHPKISIVTPSFNQDQWVEKTIQSVLNQNLPDVEYIIVDGNSTDGTKDILAKYNNQLNHLIIEPDQGMYDALDKGFKLTTGAVMGWINSDDMLHPNALLTVKRIFEDLPEVEWLTGCRTVFDEQDCCVATEPAASWSRAKVLSGDYKWIQQESTFWRRNLYEKAGGFVSQDFKLAGDFELWSRFFAHAQLYSTDALLGGFRVRRENQASLEGLSRYEEEVKAIIDSTKKDKELLNQIDLYKQSQSHTVSRRIKSRLFDSAKATPFFPPRIYFDRQAQRFKLHSQ